MKKKYEHAFDTKISKNLKKIKSEKLDQALLINAASLEADISVCEHSIWVMELVHRKKWKAFIICTSLLKPKFIYAEKKIPKKSEQYRKFESTTHLYFSTLSELSL